MSYILDALRKSETERRQGRVPDLGQQVQLIHRPRKKGISPVVWVALALALNAGVLAYVFWPEMRKETLPGAGGSAAVIVPAPAAPAVTETAPAPVVKAPEKRPDPLPASVPESRERATIIVPSSASDSLAASGDAVVAPQPAPEQAGRVPHLVELPVSFQKDVPDLTFNSHIYSSEPASRRVMINNTYLRVGDTFEGLRVEDITEDGVVLSRDGRRFRVGVVRDWVSPR